MIGVSTFALCAMGAASAARAQTSVVLDPITVVATKTEERTTDSLAAVSAVRQEEINRIMPGRISDVFQSMPSVWFQERGDDPGTAISIRGLQDFGRVAVLIDGARQNFQRTGHNADGLFYMEPELLAAADVARGPVSNVYGSGAIGGVVSLRTKDVADILKEGERYGVLTHGQLGTNNGRGLGSAFGAVRANPNLDVFVGTTYRKNDNYSPANSVPLLNTFVETETAISKMTYRPALGHEVKLSALAYESNFNNGTPNAANTATIQATRAQNFITSARWKYSRPEDRMFDFDGNVYWTRTDINQKKIAGTSSLAGGFLGASRGFTIDTAGTDINNTSRFDTGPIRHALTYGGDWFQDKVNVEDVTGTGDLFAERPAQRGRSLCPAQEHLEHRRSGDGHSL
jgi:hemoglobin/transferrin/lactoferrin receptor protein